jgi:hypothetical protein
MSYLDDKDHDWSLDTTLPVPTMGDMVDELANRELMEEELRIIFQGFIGLVERHPHIPFTRCLHTSMIWYFG